MLANNSAEWWSDFTLQTILIAFFCLINIGKILDWYVLPQTIEQYVIYGRNSVQYNLYSGSLPSKCCTLCNIPTHFYNLFST